MRKIKSLILAVLILVFSFSLYSCNDGNLKQTISIEKVDENKIQALYVGKKYDASSIFVQENGIKYEIDSLFYFDKNGGRRI